MNRTFLLGVGAQKAGTTWLHNSLASSTQVNFGVTKEYHIWDALYSELFTRLRLTEDAMTSEQTRRSVRFLMQNEADYYGKYFKEILDHGWQLTGDITPSYSVLSAEDFKQVRSQLESIDARLRVVFLMRDPFERCWSATRMHKRNREVDEPEEALLLDRYRNEGFIQRTRYDRTVRNLRAVFSEAELHFGLYETMHEESELQRLSDFLGVRIDRATIHHRYNASPKTEGISPETATTVRNFYREVYEFCWKEFPASRQHWHL